MAIFFFHFFFFAFGGGGSVSHRFFSPAWEIVENPVCKIETARNFNTNFNSQKRCWPISSLHVDIHVRLITISDLLIYLTRSFSKVKLSSFRWGREGGGAPPPPPGRISAWEFAKEEKKLVMWLKTRHRPMNLQSIRHVLAILFAADLVPFRLNRPMQRMRFQTNKWRNKTRPGS